MKKLLLILAISFNAMADDVDATYAKLGQEHGCSSGHFAGGSNYYQHKKDNSYYNSYQAYKAAWDVYYERCKIERMRMEGMITDSLSRGW